MPPTPTDIVHCTSCGTKNRVPSSATGVPRCGKCATALPWVTEAGDDDFERVVEKANVPVLVDLWAEWCGPCRMVSPVLEQLARQMAGHLKLVRVNIDKAPGTAARFEARSIPTLLLLRDGAVVSRQVGAAPAHALRQWVDSALSGEALRPG
jgi:thioredoxin 2